jgi:hypothetical protein
MLIKYFEILFIHFLFLFLPWFGNYKELFCFLGLCQEYVGF